MIKEKVNQRIREMQEIANYGIRSLADAENRPDVKVMRTSQNISIWVKKNNDFVEVFNFVLFSETLLEESYVIGKNTLKCMSDFLEG